MNCRGNTRFLQKARDLLSGPDAREIVAVIGLLDLYGLDFPSTLTSPKERYEWAVTYFQEQVSKDRFHMYFAVHEFEAWILGQPDALPRSVRNALPQSAVAYPENVNFIEPPAQLLNRVYLSQTNRRYRKTTNGKILFQKIEPQVVAGKCPYLKKMLDEMLTLAKAAGL